MTAFAKLFNTEHGQLLVTTGFNDTDHDREDAYRITMRGEGNDTVAPEISFGWPTREERDKVFESTELEDVAPYAAQMASICQRMFPVTVQ